VLSVGAGAAAGGVVVAMLVGFRGSPLRRVQPPAESSVAPPATARTSVDLSRIEAELQNLREQAIAGQASSAAPGSPPPAPDPASMDPQAAWARTTAEYRAAIDAHDKEPRDSRWAATESRVIGDDLARDVGDKTPFHLVSVDCRTTTCVADVQFDNYRAARAWWPQVLNGRRVPGCGVQVVLDKTPDDPEQAYHTGVLFDCENGRSAE